MKEARQTPRSKVDTHPLPSTLGLVSLQKPQLDEAFLLSVAGWVSTYCVLSLQGWLTVVTVAH